MKLHEIEKIPPSEYVGGKSYLNFDPDRIKLLLKNSKPLPGGSRYVYSVIMFHNDPRIIILDPEYSKQSNRAIARLVINKDPEFPLKSAYEVDTITVHEDYRAQNLAKALYGLALLPKPDGLGAILLSGWAQTPGGQNNWVSLSKIPGVEVTGFVKIRESVIDIEPKTIDDLMGKLGAQYIGKNGDCDYRVFQFPIEARNEIENAQKSSMFKIYHTGQYPKWLIGLMAKYVG